LANAALDHNPAPAAIRDLLPPDLLLRALTKQKWLEDLHEAFLLRSDETGLSVCFDCSPEECIAVLNRNGLHGVASLTVDGVTGLQLTVTPDEPHHAIIEGMPHKEDDAATAERLASQLAAIATIVDRTRRKRLGDL
jgi:hypothetical protein